MNCQFLILRPDPDAFLIIDLRNCSGGYASMNGYFATFFFAEATKLYDMEFRGDNFTERYRTMDYLPEKKLVDTPLIFLPAPTPSPGRRPWPTVFKT